MVAQWIAFPLLLGGAIGLAVAVMPRVGPVLAVALAQAVALVAIALAERLLPYRPRWNRSHGDVGTDALHAVFSGLGTTQLMRPVAVYLGGLGAALVAGAGGAGPWPHTWPLMAQLALALVIAELPQYWLHRWQHTYDLLWRFHAVHHSAPRLYWLNAARFHPLDLGLLYLVGYVPLVVLGCPGEVILLFALFDGVFGMLQHCNVAVRLGPLNWLFSMAEPHRWHHSRTLVEANSNYGSNLIVWDLVFGTFFLPRDREPPEAIGIAGMPDFPPGYLGQLAAPFEWARLRGVLAVVAAAVLLHALPAPAARPDRAERRCERVVAKASVKFLRAALHAPDDHAGAATAFAETVRRACPDAAVAAVAFGGECAGSDSTAALVRCLVGSHEARIADLHAILGSDGAAEAKLVRKCRATVARAVARVLLEKNPRDERLRARIARRCTDDLVDAAAFGAPCAGRAAEAMASCVLREASVAAELLRETTRRDRGFCGDDAERVEKRIDALLADMTLEEKVSQMHGTTLDHGWRTPAIERLGIPGFGMLDGPRGVSRIAGMGTAFPVAIARGATFDPVLEERVGEAIAREVRAKGADVLLAPVLNIVRHPRGGRTQESYGEDTVLLGAMGTAFVGGAQRHVIASVKHFAANSIENTRFTVDVEVDERALREVYLPHFRRAVEQGHAASVMSAYNQVNGAYCAENPPLLHDVLKRDWRFRGFVESDWFLGTHSAVPSLEAGLDIEMPSGVYYGTPLLDAVATGAASEALVDAAVRRILRAQLCFRLDTDPPVPDDTIPGNPEHLTLARHVAEEAIVLLKNGGRALPLVRTQLSSLAVVGTLADVPNLGDTGSSAVVPSAVVTPLAGIEQAAGAANVTYVAGPPLDPADAAAVAAADAAIVVVGLTADDEGEGLISHGDRDSLVLPRDQDDLVAAVAALNPRTIVVLEGSGPVLMPWLADVPAVLTTWYPGQEGGRAIADVLFGDVVPSGKLPLSFPRAESDLPTFDPVSLTVTYDYWHGYRHLDRTGATPLFPFGFGLSYTTFAFTNVTAAPAVIPAGGHARITAEVTNTGAVAGTEVAQLYVGYEGSRVERALRDLKAFSRVDLAPGQTKTVVFDLPTADLAYWDVTTHAWVIEPITYHAYVGDSSRDTPLSAAFTVTEFAAGHGTPPTRDYLP